MSKKTRNATAAPAPEPSLRKPRQHDALAGEAPFGLDPATTQAYCARIVAEGFVSAKDLIAQFGQDFHNRAVAYLYRNLRLLIEKRLPSSDGASSLGYMWANRKLSKPDRARIPATFGFINEFKATGPKYDKYETVVVRCRWLDTPLGAIPAHAVAGLGGGDDVKDLCVFEPPHAYAKRRDGGGPVKIAAYCLRAMFVKVLPTMGKEAALARRIYFRNVWLQNICTEEIARGTVDPMTGAGLGIRRNEAIPAGTEFTIEADVPTSILMPEEYVMALARAGKMIRFSPASSRGFGEFEVLRESAESKHVQTH